MLSGVPVSIVSEPYPLVLRTAFGTSHSSTQTRTNFLLTLQIGSTKVDKGQRDDALFGDDDGSLNKHQSDVAVRGYGEVGLPPKKAGVYEADLADCDAISAVIADFIRQCLARQSTTTQESASATKLSPEVRDPFQSVPEKYFHSARSHRQSSPTNANIAKVCQYLLNCIDLYAHEAMAKVISNEGAHRAVKSGWEVMILDAWSRALSMPLYEFIGLDRAPSHPGYYTAGLNKDIAIMADSAKFGLQFTPFLKIKLNGDFELGKAVLRALKTSAPPSPGHWSIDANSDWTPDVALQFKRL